MKPVAKTAIRALGQLSKIIPLKEPVIHGMPLIHAVPMVHDESVPHAHALTSLVIFETDTVEKIYAPGLLPRCLYWLAFQAPFPYIGNRAALEAAVLRRELAGMFTEHWYGERRVARALGVRDINGRLSILSERIHGNAVTNVATARAFLFDLASLFDEAGFPTWQIDPRQPRSLGNLIERPDGTFVVIDLESGLVSLLASPRSWLRAIRRGSVPLFDEVYFDLTRSYAEQHIDVMRQQNGEAWVDDLFSLLNLAEVAEQRWHASEPRIWRRLLRRFWQIVGVDLPGGATRHSDAGRHTPDTDRINLPSVNAPILDALPSEHSAEDYNQIEQPTWKGEEHVEPVGALR